MDEIKTTSSSLSTSDTLSQQSNPITRKLNKILESRIENDKVCSLVFFILIVSFNLKLSKRI